MEETTAVSIMPKDRQEVPMQATEIRAGVVGPMLTSRTPVRQLEDRDAVVAVAAMAQMELSLSHSALLEPT